MENLITSPRGETCGGFVIGGQRYAIQTREALRPPRLPGPDTQALLRGPRQIFGRKLKLSVLDVLYWHQ